MRSATLATVRSALGQADRVGAALQSAATDLANTLDEIGATLDRLAEKTKKICHYTMDVDYLQAIQGQIREGEEDRC